MSYTLSFIDRLKAKFRRYFNNEVVEEIHNLIDAHDDNDPLTKNERDLISAVLKFDDIEANTVAISRSDITHLKKSSSFEKILTTFQKTRHTRLPVIHENLDNVVGFITLKDIMMFVGKEKEFKIKNILRPVTFVPDTMSLPHILQLMKKNKVQMVLTIDEYGGTAGLISLKDILEQLVGSMEDEHEEEEFMLFPLTNGHFRIDPRMPITRFSQHVGYNVQTNGYETDFETVGGFVLALAGRVPHKNESFQLKNNYVLTVTNTDGRRILSLELHAQPSS